MKELLNRIYSSIKDSHSLKAMEDLMYMCKEAMKEKETLKLGVSFLIMLSDKIESLMPKSDNPHELYKMHRRVVFAGARESFHLYLLAVEWNREPSKKFYPPRKRVLRWLVNDLQDLADGELDFLGISLPPRVGKSTLCIFFMTWIMGRIPDVASVMSGHSDKLTDGFYKELLSIIEDSSTYLWGEVFTGTTVVETSSKNETIDLNRKKRFPTMTCRSIGGTLTGAVEIGNGGILYCDDLIEDLEEATNPDRLDSKYDAYLNQLKDRMKEDAVQLMVGTRWAVKDPLGRIQEQYEGNPRYRFTVIPALNDQDKSNFLYDYNVGFSTKYYHDMRESIDHATWCAKYMGHPYEREGLVFPYDELNFYNGVLPEGDHYVVAACDVAWGGGDSVSMPVAYVFGKDVYIDDWVFNQGDKEVSRPVVIGMLKRHVPSRAVFESNNGGHEYADIVDEQLRADGVHINISSKPASGNASKLARIIQYAPDIKRFYFRDEKHRSQEYNMAMKEFEGFTQNGKVKHDDAPDSLAQLAKELFHGTATVTIVKRPF